MRVNKGQQLQRPQIHQNNWEYKGDLGSMKIYSTDIQIKTKNI